VIEAYIFYLTSLTLVKAGLSSILLEYVERFNPNFEVEKGAVEGRSQGYSGSRVANAISNRFLLAFAFKKSLVSIGHLESYNLVFSSGTLWFSAQTTSLLFPCLKLNFPSSVL
jgi:hypothetical protein